MPMPTQRIKSIWLYCLSYCCCILSIMGQNRVADTTDQQTCRELVTLIELENDFEKRLQLTERLLKRAKKSQDSLYLRTGYHLLINLYENGSIVDLYKNQQNHLSYLNRLIALDSSLQATKTPSNNQGTLKKLRSDRRKLVKALKLKEIKNQQNSKLLIAVCCIFMLVITYILCRNQLYKKRFGSISKKNKDNLQEKSMGAFLRYGEIGLPKKTAKRILTALEEFEKTTLFLQENITLESLAKELDTNSSYLSKVINKVKHISFSTYLNELRIDYVINRLTKDSTFRSYTIKAIGKEAGYHSEQSFSRAFHKKTGLYPSFFIKKLQQQDGQNNRR